MRATGRGCSVAALSTLALVAVGGGCATTQYTPQVVARGELTLRYDGRIKMSAGGQEVTGGLTYPRLDELVKCVPAAHQHAREAQAAGRAAVTLSILGGVFGAGGLVAIGGLVDSAHWGPWIGAGLGSASLGLVLSILSWREKNAANGHAVDALNFYNDSVGSLGATCADLRYPPSAGPDPYAGAAPAPPAAAPLAAPDPAAPSLPPPPVVRP